MAKGSNTTHTPGVTGIPNAQLDEKFGMSELSMCADSQNPLTNGKSMSNLTLTIGAYRQQAELKIEQLAEKLGCSKGYASDLCSGKQHVTQRIARRMEGLTGIPWHKWIQPPKESAA